MMANGAEREMVAGVNKTGRLWCNTKIHGGYMSTQSNSMDMIMRKAFVTAYLLTANVEQAESAVMEAIDSWDADDDTDVSLIRRALHAAVLSDYPDKPKLAEPPLSDELQAVLRLSSLPRRCFVLRILAGLSTEVCSRLLRLSSLSVDEYTCAAMTCLGSLHTISEPASV